MKTKILCITLSAALLAILPGIQTARAQSVWNATVGVSANTNWSTAGNWSPSGVPGADTNVVFDDTTEVATTANNNVVDVNTTISSLTYAQTNDAKFQNTLIASGVTLSVTNTGGLFVGFLTNASGVSVRSPVTTISGAGGTLVVSNGPVSLNLGQGAVGGGVTLNMTNLGTFNFTGSRLTVGTGLSAYTRSAGVSYLARTNMITLTSTNASPQLDVAENTANAGASSILYLGVTNVIYADSIATGRNKQSGGLIAFNPSFFAQNPGAYIRGTNGIGPVSTWTIADCGNSGGTTSSSGTNDFTGGSVNFLVNSMVLARPSTNATSGRVATGILSFDAGIISVANLTNGLALGAAGFTSTARGTINVIGANATLAVSGGLVLGYLEGATNTSTGTLNLTNGTVAASKIIVGGGTGTINLNGGTLILTNTAGTSAAPLTALNLTGGTLRFNVSTPATVTNLVATAVTTNGTTAITIDSISGYTSGTVNYPLIKYSGTDRFNAFATLTLPSGFAGSLVDNTAAGRIDLQITSGPAISPIPLNFSQAGNVLTFSWTGTFFKLQAQTNTLNVGLYTNWGDYPGGTTSPVTVTNSPANPAVFFRLISP